MKSSADVVIIGLGAMGSAAAYALSERRESVVAFEQFPAGHQLGSSHGSSRVIRMGYFEDPSYVELLKSAYPLWRKLEERSEKKLLTVTGILEAGGPKSELWRKSMDSLRPHPEYKCDEMTAKQVNSKFPAFRLPHDWGAVYQPDGGFLLPEVAVRGFCSVAESNGAELNYDEAVKSIEPSGATVTVSTQSGRKVEAGSVIVTAGAWLGDLLSDLRRHLILTRQPTAWLSPFDPSFSRSKVSFPYLCSMMSAT